MTISSITPECINEVMNTKANENPEVGMGATMFVGSDRYPMVVVKVLSKKTVEVAHVPNEFMNKFSTDKNGIMTLQEEYLASLTMQESHIRCVRMGDGCLKEKICGELPQFDLDMLMNIWIHVFKII